MEANNIDKNIKNKLESRMLTPSVSAWERLSLNLDEQSQKKKKGWLFFAGIAASFLLLISIGFQLFLSETEEIKPKDEVVVSPIDKKQINSKIDNLINEFTVKEVIVNNKEQVKKRNNTPKNVRKVISTTKSTRPKPDIKLAEVELAKVEVVKEEKVIQNIESTILKQDSKSTIKVNADELLYAVTHTSKEVNAYHAKYKINRDDLLKTINTELKKSNIKVNPNTILAEVERSIENENFENNFMKSLKRRVSDIATVIASRNN